jgi:hypothetical protein
MEDKENVERDELEELDPELLPERAAMSVVRLPGEPVDPTVIPPPPLAE